MSSRLRKASRRHSAPPSALLSLLLLAELPVLGLRPLVRDETTSVEVAQRHWGAFWELLHHLDAPLGLYYLLLRPIVAVSDGSFAVRVPSLVGAVAAVAILVLTVDRRFGRQAAFWSGLVMVANPGLWLLADFARPYTLALAVAALTLYVLLVRPECTVLYGVAALLLVYLQLLFALFLAAQGVWILYQRRFRLLAALCVVAVASLPLVIVASGESVMTGWIPLTSVSSLRDEFTNLFGEAGIGSNLAGALTVALVVLALRVREARLVALLGAAPAAVLVIAGFTLHLLGSRYFFYVVLTSACAAGIGLAAARSAVVKAGAACLLGLAVAFSATHIVTLDYVQEDLRSATAYLLAHDRPGDVALYDPDWARPGMEYWLGRAGGQQPEDIAVRPGTVPARTGNLFLPERPAAEIEAILAAHTRVWVVGYPGQPWRPTPNVGGDIGQAAQRSWITVDHKKFGEIELLLLQRPEASSPALLSLAIEP